MGLFNFFKKAKAIQNDINKISQASSFAIGGLLEYKITRIKKIKEVYTACWVFKHCVIALAIKNQWNPFSKVIITKYGMEELSTVLDRFNKNLESLRPSLNEEQQDIIIRILNDETTPEIDNLIDDNIKSQYRVF